MLECVQLHVHLSYGLSSTRPYRGLDELWVITAGSVALMMPFWCSLPMPPEFTDWQLQMRGIYPDWWFIIY